TRPVLVDRAARRTYHFDCETWRKVTLGQPGDARQLVVAMLPEAEDLQPRQEPIHRTVRIRTTASRNRTSQRRGSTTTKPLTSDNSSIQLVAHHLRWLPVGGEHEESTYRNPIHRPDSAGTPGGWSTGPGSHRCAHFDLDRHRQAGCYGSTGSGARPAGRRGSPKDG